MKIAIASGKGGTGKTTLAINMALSLENVQLLDCDVEEPNCNLFLKYDLEEIEYVKLKVPFIDNEKCDLCGKCSDFCRFNALATLPERIMVFDALCHGCGGCALVCPVNAITEKERSIGRIERSQPGISAIELYHGLLNIGEPMASPLIEALKEYIHSDGTTIIDAPPGTACPVITSLDDVDYCILVTEPTPFGLNDLKLAVEVVRKMDIPHGVVINRSDMGDDRVRQYCISEDIPLLLEIPFVRQIAETYSNGIPFVTQMPEWKEKFVQMFERIQETAEAIE
ncbi:MAG: ATP-binding protein [Euryarchaeota archaeon]|nr:ATP-binding protein [Euryarchaeota archaeon]